MFFLLPLVGAAVGAAAGAFVSHAAGEKDRQAANNHRQVANDLSNKYSELQKRYNEYADKSKQQINALTQQHALDETEKDLLRLVIRLQQSLYTLMWDIDEQPTYKVLVEFEKAVLTTNTVLFELKEEFIQVPDRYFSRNLERANEIVAELPSEKLKGDIYPLVLCPQCGQQNRIRPHDLKFTIICGNCSSELRKAYEHEVKSSDGDEERQQREETQKQSQQQKLDLIFNKLRDIVVYHLEVNSSDVLLSSKFAYDLGADELDAVELVMAVEEEFNIEIPDDDVFNIETVRDAVNYIHNKICTN
jgi:acyl carrier protein